MDKERLQEYRELVTQKAKQLWENLSEEAKWAKEVTEIRLQMEFMEAKQDRLFKEYGKAVFLSGRCDGIEVDGLLKEIEAIEGELQKKYLALQKLKSS